MTFEQQTIGEFLDAVASKQPTPGGGAVASIVMALGATLGQMVLSFSLGRRALIAHDAMHTDALGTLQELRERALRLADEDAAAYQKLNTLWKLDKDDPQRIEQFQDAVERAIAAPHAMLHACMEVLRLLKGLCGTTNAMLASDLAIAAILAEAGARAAAWNVRINLPLLEDQAVRDTFTATIGQTLADAAAIASEIERQC